jgi:hypothetical protein
MEIKAWMVGLQSFLSFFKRLPFHTVEHLFPTNAKTSLFTAYFGSITLNFKGMTF